jgi:hypothetical protein
VTATLVALGAAGGAAAAVSGPVAAQSWRSLSVTESVSQYGSQHQVFTGESSRGVRWQ